MSVRAPVGAMGKTAYDVVLGRGVAGIVGNEFLFQALSKKETEGYWSTVSAGSTFDSINGDELRNTPIDCPRSEPECEAIGSCLSKIDQLIALHQREHDKLKTVKQSLLEKMFPKEGEDVPEIRFEGFTEPWEQRKLGKITNILSGSRVHKEEWRSSGVPFYRSSDVMAAFNGTDNEKAFISEDLYHQLVATSGSLQQGDVLVTGGGSVGIPFIVPNDQPLYTKDADLIWIKRCDSLNPDFLFTFFESPAFRSYIESISHVGTIAHYTIEQVKETPAAAPELEEQRFIGTFFSELDTLITLHQRELEILKNLKKAMLEKMFV